MKKTKPKPKPKMMDADTFLRKLGRLKGNGWANGFREPDQIRCQNGWCPILALYHSRVRRFNYDNNDYPQAAKVLGIPRRLADRIATAADDSQAVTYAAFRRRLLTTLGLV